MDIPLALTYDDVLIVPQRSDIQSRRQVDTTSQLTRNITVKVPVVAANMDSIVGDSRMCIAMARVGGAAVLHRFMSIEEMCEEIRKTKRAESIMIEDPYTILETHTMQDAVDLMRDKGISGLPVLNGENHVIGILTRRDVLAASIGSELVYERMTRQDKLITAPVGTNHDVAQEMMSQGRVEKLLILHEDGQLAGLITMRDIRYQAQYPDATKDATGRLVVGAAVGVRGDYLERAQACEIAGADFLCLDIAHGHADHAIEALKQLKQAVDIDIIAGNIATAEAAQDLIDAGADAIKAGIGAGAVCSTRVTAGVGYPMISSILQIAPICKAAGVPLIADGGMRMPADLAKALGVGADTVMVGRLLAGCKETPGEIVRNANGRMTKTYRGMASAGAAKKRQELDEPIIQKNLMLSDDSGAGGTFGHTFVEGVEGVVPFQDRSAIEICTDLMSGVKSGMSYTGARNMPEFHEKVKFVRITSAGLIESHPHDVEL